jgi:AcrR family transcriptional regulator/DNA-binding XRE family transcriptional regulator
MAVRLPRCSDILNNVAPTPRAESIRLGRRLRALRLEQGLSLRALASQLCVSAPTLSAIENGMVHLTVDRLVEMARRLDVPAYVLFQPDASPSAEAAPIPAELWRSFEPLAVDVILAAALDAFVETGYHGATVRTIAARAGVSIPSVYHRYASKQELLVRILDLTMDELDWRVRAAAHHIDGPVPRLARLVEAVALFHASRPDLAFIGASEMRSIEEPERTRIARRRSATQHLIDAQIFQAIEQGQARTRMPLEVGRVIATMCTSLPQWFNKDGPTTPAAIARECATLALRMIDTP